MTEKLKQFSPAYASIFQDASVVAAYEHRPPYSPEAFEMLYSLIPSGIVPKRVLDAGCGTGFIARQFAPYVDQIDAIDISERMIAMARTLPGGDRSTITWTAAPIETARLHGPYALIVAAASLHWMDWNLTLPRFAANLHPNCVLAVVEEHSLPNPWDAEIGPILARYSQNRDFVPYDMGTVLADIEQRGLFQLQGFQETHPMPFSQAIDSWIESVHARNGFSRDRMDPTAAQACDQELRQALLRYCSEGRVEQQIATRIRWGKPLGPS